MKRADYPRRFSVLASLFKTIQRSRIPGCALGILSILAAAAPSLIAQTGGGATLVGTVKDSSGAAVAGANVKVVNTDTSFLTTTTSQPDGSYYVPYLTPGNYRVSVNSRGL